ncbi:RNA cytidine acetyltransferase 1 [Tanacetum coccineum]
MTVDLKLAFLALGLRKLVSLKPKDGKEDERPSFGGGDKGDDGCGRRMSAALGLAIAGAGFDMLEYKEHLDYDIVKSSNPELKKVTTRINIYKQHRQTIHYIQPHEYTKLSHVKLLVVNEAAAIPLPIVKSLLRPYLVFLSSTVNGYEDFNESIRYASGDPLELWLNNLLCLDIANSIHNINRFPTPSECDLYYVNRDILFSYHKDIKLFLQRMMALYVSSHYKNSPNDLQLLADAPAHHLFVLLDPINESKNQLPDILYVIQFQDKDFLSLSGARIVHIATHPNAMKLGYGSAAIELLSRTNKWSKLSVFTPTITEEPPSHIEGEIEDTKKEKVSKVPKHEVLISIVKPTEGLSNPESSNDSERHIREPIWNLDSGCSRGITGGKSYLHKYVEQPGPKVVFGDNSSCITEGYGLINCGGIIFTKAAFANGLKYNLISISELCDAKYIVQFNDKQGTIFNANKEIILIAPRRNDVYVLDMSSLTLNGACFFAKASKISPMSIQHEKYTLVIVDEYSSVALNEHETPHTEDAEGPPGLINTKGTHEQNVQDEHIITQPTEGPLGNNTEVSVSIIESLVPDIEPKKVSEALKHPGWVDAIEEELNQFYRNKLWTFVPLSYGKTSIVSKWVFRNKKDEHGIITKHKVIVKKKELTMMKPLHQWQVGCQ